MPRPVRPLRQSATEVAKAAKADKERKAASKAALKAVLNAVHDSDADESEVLVQKPAAPIGTPSQKALDEARHADNLEAAKAEAEATGMSFEEACESMGIDPNTGAPAIDKTPYNGPMVALKAARKTYVKAANGILCNGSPLAILCGQYKREIVVKALIAALKLEGNPYAHLNPGQQSMNLRNKARHAIGQGTLSMAEVEAELKAEAAITNIK